MFGLPRHIPPHGFTSSAVLRRCGALNTPVPARDQSRPGPTRPGRTRLVFSNYDAPGNPYYNGGGARAIHEIARRLVARYDVRVVTGRFPGSRDEIRDGVAYERIGVERAGPQLGQLLYQAALPWRVRRGDFDLWVESLTPPFSTACLPWFTRRPVVALTQVLAGAAMARKYHLPFGAIERLGLRAYRHAIVLSHHLQRVVTTANRDIETVIIPNGVPRELIELPLARTEEHLLFLGRLDIEQKGLDLLLTALRGLAGRLDLPVLIAGSGPAAETARLERAVAEHGLAGSVRLIGRVDDRRKSELMQQALALLLPSRFEASPLVLIEALCHALPVLAFDIPELGDIPNEVCVKVPPFDATRYGEALLKLRADADRRAALGGAAKQYAHRFDWDDLARSYAAFCDRILGRGAGD